MITAPFIAPAGLTADQRRIVEWTDGPVVVIAGAGTGKTRVIVERVRYLLDHVEGLLPENLLVLTYNVKAARGAPGPARPNRRAGHASPHDGQQLPQLLPARPDRVGRGRRTPAAAGRAGRRRAGAAAQGHQPAAAAGLPLPLQLGVHRLRPVHQPRQGRAGHAGRLRRLRRRGAPRLRGALRQLPSGRGTAHQPGQPSTAPPRPRHVRVGAHERACGGARRGADYDANAVEKIADREARRTLAGTGGAMGRNWFPEVDKPRIDALAATYVADGAALEVLRLTELAAVYHAYEEELARRGALDFGEQIAAVTQLFKKRPNVLRRYQRQYRYLLVDEFQDANVAQIELIELLGRTPDRPDNVMVVGDDDQSIYRFRGASFAAFAEFDTRFSRPPAHDPMAWPPGPPHRLKIEHNFRSVRNVLTAANRLIGNNETRFEPDKRLTTDREDGAPIELITCAGPEDEAVAIVDAIKSMTGRGPAAGTRMSPCSIASTSTATPSWPGCATRTSRTPWSAA